jgi:hypothetical protein
LFSLAASAEPQPRLDSAVATGVAQVKRGDNERGIQTLDAAVKRLAPSKEHSSDVAIANVYMGVAYMNQGHSSLARDRFREASRIDKGLRLDPEEFAPPVIEAYEEARKSGSDKKKTAMIGGIGAVVGAGTAALFAGGSSEAATTPTNGTPASTTTVTTAVPTPACTAGGNPRVTLTFPEEAASLSGIIILRASAFDDGGVAEVRFFVDDRLIGLASAGEAELRWDTRLVPNGTHQFSARAFDGCLNQGFSQPVTVFIRN